LVAFVAAWLYLAAPASAAPSAPAYAGDFPDPFVLVSGGQYWAYGTGSAGLNLQVTVSADLQNWSDPVDPLPVLPWWATTGFTWAPAVADVRGQFLMYYTVRQTASGRQCISVASADSPEGPFVDDSDGPLVCQLDHLGSIDAAPFAWHGQSYLVWKSEDNAVGAQTHLWAQLLTPDGRGLVGEPTRLLSQTAAWQSPAIEGPSMLANGKEVILFYGAGDWASEIASVGWASCDTPLGPCTDQSLAGPWLSSRSDAQGPSGPATFTDISGATRFAYHAWTGAIGYPNGGARSLFIGELTFTPDGRPVLR
jgi:GH43 family beta-xylosidase